MPVATPPEFRRRSGALARQGEQPAATITRDLRISVSCPRRWMDVDDVDAGRKDTATRAERAERAELVELRRRDRVLEMEVEVEIVERASAYLAREISSSNDVPAGRGAGCRRCPCRGDLPGARDLPLGLLRVGAGWAVPAGRGRCLPHEHDHGDPRDVVTFLLGPAGAP